MMHHIEGIIFDLDGTLVDSMWIWKSIDIEYLARFQISLPENLQTEIEGMSFHETALYFKEHFHIEDSLDKIKDDWNQMAWDKYAKEVPLKNGVSELLEYAKTHQIKLGIASSNSRELVDLILDVHKIADYFDIVVTGSEVKKGKPWPEIYLKAADKMEVSPERCLVFEDIIPGIMAGKNAGMKVCAIDDAYSEYARKEKKESSDYFIHDYTEVMNNGKWIFTD